MEERAKIPVSPPHAQPTTSYWQDPPSDIADLRTSTHLPSSADFVIIGSGISGASIAYNLLFSEPEASIILLEARQACSGATGRNGGHTKAASYRSFVAHEHEYGVEEAVKIARLEYDNIRATHAFARQYNIECASTECQTVDIIYDHKQLNLATHAVANMTKAMGSQPAAQYHFWDAKETETRFLTPGALGSVQYTAGSLSAYAFTIGVLKLALERGLNLQTSTPVTSLSRNGLHWTVSTSRGQITTAKVILATNGYTANLLPEMQGLVVPLQGQVVAQHPGLSLPVLKYTYSFIYETGYEYMITRPHGSADEGHIIIGGGIHQLPWSGASRYGNTDDSSLEPTITEYLRNCTKASFGDNWGADDPGGRIIIEWSGIMGATADGLPYVGEMPDMPGVWIIAGFNGHGMVLCLKAAEALARMMGDRDIPDWFPQSMLITKNRMMTTFTGRMDLRAPGEASFGSR